MLISADKEALELEVDIAEDSAVPSADLVVVKAALEVVKVDSKAEEEWEVDSEASKVDTVDAYAASVETLDSADSVELVELLLVASVLPHSADTVEFARFTTTLTEEVLAVSLALKTNMPVLPPKVSSLRLIQQLISEIRLKKTLVSNLVMQQTRLVTSLKTLTHKPSSHERN